MSLILIIININYFNVFCKTGQKIFNVVYKCHKYEINIVLNIFHFKLNITKK